VKTISAKLNFKEIVSPVQEILAMLKSKICNYNCPQKINSWMFRRTNSYWKLLCLDISKAKSRWKYTWSKKRL